MGAQKILFQDSDHERNGKGPGFSGAKENASLRYDNSLDHKIEAAQHVLSALLKEGKVREVEAIKLVYAKLMDQKVAEIYANGKVEETKIEADARIKTAETEARESSKLAQVKKDIIKLDQAPNQIDQVEMEVFNIVKKHDVLADPKAFENLVNTSSDKTIKNDALILERDLKKLGMNLKVDGVIGDDTISAIEALISKNAPAIKVYKEVTGIDPVKATPASKPVFEKDGR